jgi:hypothetical protein
MATKYMITWNERPQGSPVEYENARNSQAPPLDGRVELPKQQVTENRWTTSN